MQDLSGEYSHSVDAKGRMMVPSKLRESLGISFKITKGYDNCLQIFPMDSWERFADKLKALPSNNKNARLVTRFFLGSAQDCEVDSQGRVNIPQILRDYAGITKEVTVLGMGDHAEIWSTENYQGSMPTADEIEDITSVLAEEGFNI